MRRVTLKLWSRYFTKIHQHYYAISRPINSRDKGSLDSQRAYLLGAVDFVVCPQGAMFAVVHSSLRQTWQRNSDRGVNAIPVQSPTISPAPF